MGEALTLTTKEIIASLYIEGSKHNNLRVNMNALDREKISACRLYNEVQVLRQIIHQLTVVCCSQFNLVTVL